MCQVVVYRIKIIKKIKFLKFNFFITLVFSFKKNDEIKINTNIKNILRYLPQSFTTINIENKKNNCKIKKIIKIYISFFLTFEVIKIKLKE